MHQYSITNKTIYGVEESILFYRVYSEMILERLNQNGRLDSGISCAMFLSNSCSLCPYACTCIILQQSVCTLLWILAPVGPRFVNFLGGVVHYVFTGDGVGK